jgi:hypothetical protein
MLAFFSCSSTNWSSHVSTVLRYTDVQYGCIERCSKLAGLVRSDQIADLPLPLVAPAKRLVRFII